MGEKIGLIYRGYANGKEKGYIFSLDGIPKERSEIRFNTHKAAAEYAERHFPGIMIIDDSRKEAGPCRKKRTPGRRRSSKKLKGQ